jgi:hypothetical protein
MKLKYLAAFVFTLTTIGLTLPTVAGVPGLSPFPHKPQPVSSLPPVDMPMDKYIQQIVGDRLMTQIATPHQSNPVKLTNLVLAGYEDPTRKVIIESLYILILQRDVDPSGMTTWLNALASGQSVDDVRRAIAESPEAQDKLNDLYKKMLCRDIDPSGKTTWTDALATTWTLREVANIGIALSAEYQSRGGKSCN